MVSLPEGFNVETTVGEPVTARGVTVTPQAQVVSLRLGQNAGFVWNRPTAVLVEREGQVQRIPIVDVTLWAQVGFALLAGATAILMIFSLKRSREG